MQANNPAFKRLHQLFVGGLDLVEYIGLLVIGFATTVAMAQEIWVMVLARKVSLTDLLLMFLYLEVLAMAGRYLKTGQLPVRFPLYIGIVALARYLVLDVKDMNEWRMLGVASAILLLTISVLVIRYGHIKFPYEDAADGALPGGRGSHN